MFISSHYKHIVTGFIFLINPNFGRLKLFLPIITTQDNNRVTTMEHNTSVRSSSRMAAHKEIYNDYVF